MVKICTTTKNLPVDNRFVDDVESYLTSGSADQLSPEEFFKAYLTWHGIIGYEEILWDLVTQLIDPVDHLERTLTRQGVSHDLSYIRTLLG